MVRSRYLKEFQKRLPDDILISDETTFIITEDEYVAVLSWLNYFQEHYSRFGKTQKTYVQIPIISKRLRLDFTMYTIPCEDTTNKGKHFIYLSDNRKMLNGSLKKNITVSETVRNWNL